MRLRCVKGDTWVALGKSYAVLGVYGRGASLKYRVIGEQGAPALHDAELFELVSPAIPEDWVFRVYPNSEWVMTPGAFATDGFWTSYFDGDAAAQTVFDKTVAILEQQGRKG